MLEVFGRCLGPVVALQSDAANVAGVDVMLSSVALLCHILKALVYFACFIPTFPNMSAWWGQSAWEGDGNWWGVEPAS